MSALRLFSLLVKSCVFASALWAAYPAAAQSIQDEEGAEAGPWTVGQYARHYRVYRRDIDVLRDMTFVSGDEVQGAIDLIMGYEAANLTRGWFAHQALVASRAPGFMDTVRTEAAERGQAAFFASAQRDSRYLWRLSSNTAAINFVFDGLYQDAREARAVGQILNDRAFAYMDGIYGTSLPAGTVENASELLGTEEYVGDRSYDVPYRAQNVMQRVLEIAARLSLDSSGGQSLNAEGLLYEDRQTNQCLRWARLNLAQCVAAARTTAEEAYCTGKHGLDDISDCWGWMVSMDGEMEQAVLTD